MNDEKAPAQSRDDVVVFADIDCAKSAAEAFGGRRGDSFCSHGVWHPVAFPLAMAERLKEIFSLFGRDESMALALMNLSLDRLKYPPDLRKAARSTPHPRCCGPCRSPRPAGR